MKLKISLLTGLVLLLLTLLAACSPAPVLNQAAPSATELPTATPLPPTATLPPEPPCGPDNLPPFAEYLSWTRLNPQPIRGHELWVDVYVNDLAEETYRTALGETFPECATIVKAHLAGETSTVVTALTVMVKMPAGYDPAHNDWWWGMYNPAGTVAEMSGQVAVCIACHQPVAAADYVFSEAVMSAVQK